MATLDTLTRDTSPTSDDLLYVMDNPGGSKGNRAVALQYLFKGASDGGAAGHPFFDGLFSYVDPDSTFAANSDTRIASQKAVASAIAAVGGGAGALTTATASFAGYAVFLNDATLGGASPSSTKTPSQASVKSYVDALPSITTSNTGKVPVATAGSPLVTTLDVTKLLANDSAAVNASALTIYDNSDNTKIAAFLSSSIATLTTRTFTFPDLSGTLALTTGSQQFQNKTYLAATLLANVGGTGVVVRRSDASNAQETNDYATRTNQLEVLGANTSTGGLASIAGVTHSGAAGTPAAIGSGASLFRIAAFAYESDSLTFGTTAGARIQLTSRTAYSSTDHGSSIDLFICPTGSVTLTNALKITPDTAVPGVIARGAVAVGAGSALLAAQTGSALDILAGTGVVAVRRGTVALGTTAGLNSNIALPTSSYCVVTGSTGGFSIGGFASPGDGMTLYLINLSANAMTIVNEDASSTAANRITTTTGANVVTTGAGVVQLWYDTGTSRWILVGGAPGSFS